MTSLQKSQSNAPERKFDARVTTKVEVDPENLAVATLIGKIRGLLREAVAEKGIGVRELARRLRVSPAAVSRQLRSDGDLRVSTVAIMLHAIEQRLQVEKPEVSKPAHLGEIFATQMPENNGLLLFGSIRTAGTITSQSQQVALTGPAFSGVAAIVCGVRSDSFASASLYPTILGEGAPQNINALKPMHPFTLGEPNKRSVQVGDAEAGWRAAPTSVQAQDAWFAFLEPAAPAQKMPWMMDANLITKARAQ